MPEWFSIHITCAIHISFSLHLYEIVPWNIIFSSMNFKLKHMIDNLFRSCMQTYKCSIVTYWLMKELIWKEVKCTMINYTQHTPPTCMRAHTHKEKRGRKQNDCTRPWWHPCSVFDEKNKRWCRPSRNCGRENKASMFPFVIQWSWKIYTITVPHIYCPENENKSTKFRSQYKFKSLRMSILLSNV